MKINLNATNRKYIELEVEIEGVTQKLKYFEKNTKQLKRIRGVAKKEDAVIFDVDSEVEKVFYENLKGDETLIEKIKNFYDENASIYDFINDCDAELGKLTTKA